MREGPRHLVDEEGAAAAGCRPGGVEHEVVDQQLGAVFEHVRQRDFAGGRVKGVLLLDLEGGHGGAGAGEGVGFTGVGLLLLEEIDAGGAPFFRGDDLEEVLVGCGGGEVVWWVLSTLPGIVMIQLICFEFGCFGIRVLLLDVAGEFYSIAENLMVFVSNTPLLNPTAMEIVFCDLLPYPNNINTRLPYQ